MLASIVYMLCAVASFICMVLLAQSYRRTRSRLLLWSALCFVGLTINNVLLFVDLSVLPDIDLSAFRTAASLCSVTVLVMGFVLET